MVNRTLRRVVGLGSLIGLLVLWGGCAGTGERVNLHLQAEGPAVVKPEGERVEISLFEDLRPQKGRLGLRTHVWGGVTYFDVPGGNPGQAMAEMLAEYLRNKGREAWVKKPDSVGAGGSQGTPDVTLTGQVLEFSTQAKSRFGSTGIAVRIKAIIQARNVSDGSITRMVLEGKGSESVFWFEPRDVQDLVNATINESLARLIADVKVEQRAWQLK